MLSDNAGKRKFRGKVKALVWLNGPLCFVVSSFKWPRMVIMIGRIFYFFLKVSQAATTNIKAFHVVGFVLHDSPLYTGAANLLLNKNNDWNVRVKFLYSYRERKEAWKKFVEWSWLAYKTSEDFGMPESVQRQRQANLRFFLLMLQFSNRGMRALKLKAFRCVLISKEKQWAL